jgi:cytoskeletal protein RodZ
MEETPMPFTPQDPKEPQAEHYPFAPRQQDSDSRQQQPVHSKRSKRQWVLIGVGVVALLVLLLDGYNFWRQHNTADNTSNIATTPSNLSQQNTAPQSTGLNATDDASLNQDLKSIDSSMNTSSSSQSATDKALNDKSSQIDVPTE